MFKRLLSIKAMYLYAVAVGGVPGGSLALTSTNAATLSLFVWLMAHETLLFDTTSLSSIGKAASGCTKSGEARILTAPRSVPLEMINGCCEAVGMTLTTFRDTSTTPEAQYTARTLSPIMAAFVVNRSAGSAARHTGGIIVAFIRVSMVLRN